MKIIAHRGNIDGRNPLKENHPDYIDEAISKGYDVEIDIRYNTSDKKLYLGHDEPQYIVDWVWLSKHKDYLWIHCKNVESLYEFSHNINGFNYFWHQEDDFTLTSKNYIWTYPGKEYTPNSVIVMPELDTSIKFFSDLKGFNCYGICTDYPKWLVK